MKVTYLGTTVLLFDDGNDQIMFDAYFSRASVHKFLLSKVQTDTKLVKQIVKQYGIHRLKAVFVSHTHVDHVLDVPYLARTTGAMIYGSASAMNIARGGGISEDKLYSYDRDREFQIGEFTITVIPSIHSKAHWYNDDLGQTVEKPFSQPAGKKKYKEGGSYDFVVRHREKVYLIRPSCNYIEGQLDGIKADILYLGIGGITKRDEVFRKKFFQETVEKTGAKMVVPLHWDNFFKPLMRPSYSYPHFMENTEKTLFTLAKYCGEHDVKCVVQLPMTSIHI